MGLSFVSKKAKALDIINTQSIYAFLPLRSVKRLTLPFLMCTNTIPITPPLILSMCNAHNMTSSKAQAFSYATYVHIVHKYKHPYIAA